MSRAIRYHTLDDPLNPKQLPDQYSDLHTLYPGRPMPSDDGIRLGGKSEYAIESENPEAAQQTFRDVKQKTAQYGADLERLARKNGGGPKMTVHAVADASEVIEDPELKGVDMSETTPLLMETDPSLPGQTRQRLRPTQEGELRKPLVENFGNTYGPERTFGTGTVQPNFNYKWILMALLAAGLCAMAYMYATKKVDIYAF